MKSSLSVSEDNTGPGRSASESIGAIVILDYDYGRSLTIQEPKFSCIENIDEHCEGCLKLDLTYLDSFMNNVLPR